MVKEIVAVAFLVSCSVPAFARAEEFTIATYNIERFHNLFEAHRLTTQPAGRNPANEDLMYALRKANDEDKWEVAQTILDPKFNPDILVIEEGCEAATKEVRARFIADRALHSPSASEVLARGRDRRR